MSAVEMRILRWMCGKIMKKKNENFLEHLEKTPIDKKLRETHSKWFGHVQQKPPMASVRKSFSIQNIANQEKMDKT